MNVQEELGTLAAEADFAELRAAGRFYADKSRLLYSLADGFHSGLLARPPWFGKSLIVSFYEALFARGVQDPSGLFSDLKIEKLWQDHTYRVLRFDLKAILEKLDKPEELGAALKEIVLEKAWEWELSLGMAKYEDIRFSALLNELISSQPDSSVVLLVDDFDAPLRLALNCDDKRVQENLRDCADAFFSLVKCLSGKLRFAMFTGLSSYIPPNMGISITDISCEREFSTIAGFTFGEAVQFVENCRGVKLEEEEIAKLKQELDLAAGGYRFADYDNAGTEVYSPLALNALARGAILLGQ